MLFYTIMDQQYEWMKPNVIWIMWQHTSLLNLLSVWWWQAWVSITILLPKNHWYMICTRSSTCALTGFFWLLSHMIYLNLTKVLKERFLSQTLVMMSSIEVLFLSLRPEAWTFWKLNFVNPLRFTSHQKKLRKLFTF